VSLFLVACLLNRWQSASSARCCLQNYFSNVAIGYCSSKLIDKREHSWPGPSCNDMLPDLARTGQQTPAVVQVACTLQSNQGSSRNN
jgi:hypothetical protein